MISAHTSTPEVWTPPPITSAEFLRLAKFLRLRTGIDLKPGKENLVSARLAKRLRSGQFRSYRAYFNYVLEDPHGAELVEMVDALTTNHTSFFRERAHFDLLQHLASTVFANKRRLRIWSAATSTGEEAWSIGCVLYTMRGPARDFEITASDLSTRALESARRGIYPLRSIAALPPDLVQACFQPGRADGERTVIIRPALAARVSFHHLNLVEPLPSWPNFHVVFCRNVLIYFDEETQARVVSAISNRIAPGGYLFVGHSESLAGLRHPLEYVRPAVYRKPDTGRRT